MLWDKLMQEPTHVLAKEGEAILRKHRKDIAELLPNARRMTIGGHDVPAINLPHQYASDAGEILSEGEPFAAVYIDEPDGRRFSLRSSNTGLDVAAIAGLYGGGGHQHAAGFTVSSGHPLTVPFPLALQVEDDEIGLALAYSRNYAEASPYLNAT